ncbi:MAG: hypothetical protein ACXWUG_19240 [Polyangiales bacterium]
MRWLLAVLVTFLSVASATTARAEDTPALIKELDTVATWLASKKATPCTERCVVLTKLKLGGASDGALTFTLEGAVLADHAVPVPLFGPPNKVRIEGVKEDGKPAAVGFEGDHYYVMTGSKRFVITGTLTLDVDMALAIPGPLNTLEADLDKGRVVEGARLSGLSGSTIHFEHAAAAAAPAKEPTVFQLSRAIRVLRETAFEYKLTLRSGVDLGVVRLPLAMGEKVLDVTGVAGWKIEGTELVLPTAGHQALITITGTMAEAPKHLVPDARSAYEWWLLESDAEHRLEAAKTPGSAKQLDAAESPIPRTQASSRLFLAQRGEMLDLSIQTLTSIEALAAVIRDHSRTLVLTPRGDWVIDEQLTYENNGVDYLVHAPGARPIFLATDGVGERIMHKEGAATELMIGLRKGQHTVRVQAVTGTKLAPFLGVLSLPMSEQALTASRSTVHLGLPSGVHPIALLGGDKPVFFVGDELVIVAAFALLAAFLLGTSVRDRVLVTVGLFGAWFVDPTLYVAAIATLGAVLAMRVTKKLLKGSALTAGRIALACGAALIVLIALVSGSRKDATRPEYRAIDVSGGEGKVAAVNANAPVDGKSVDKVDASKTAGDAAFGNFEKNNGGWLLPGVTPVALPLPSADRWTQTTRELVTKERPFLPRLVYVTTAGLLPFLGLWLLSLGALAYLHRARIVALHAWARRWLATEETPAPEPGPAPAE